MIRVGILLLLAVNCSNLTAAELPEEKTKNNRGEENSSWFFTGGMMNFDSQVAAQDGIDSSGFYLNVGWGGHKGNFAYALGLSGIILSDNESFSQAVEDPFGNRSTASSSADAFGFFGELGYSFPFDSNNKSFDLMAGVEAINASRGIANCSNCQSESLSLDSGLYLKPRIRFYRDSGWVVSIDYHHYLSGDIENGVSLNFAWGY